ncbi:MAG TPA: membrane protein insertion efficiency factor YidD [Verrucomicrobiales bacterium]|nr:membrane protein insertion efficiency factor YidD [Verrucomicrobiales bacterium]
MNPAQQALSVGLRLYKAAVSPLLVALFGPGGWGCRYLPTCSEYALQAVAEHGAMRGTWLSIRRLGRCHPWGGCGCDPVPTPSHPRPAHGLITPPQPQAFSSFR